MNRRIITYLKRKGWTDINMVNRLFVSAFMDHYKLVPKNNELLIAYYITDEDNDSKSLKDFVVELKKNNCKYTLEELTQLFEFVISPSDRKISGAIYTPKYIREKIVNEVTSEYSVEELCSKRFADISCGCGGFFLSVVQLIHNVSGKKFAEIYRDNIYGIDIQEQAVSASRELLASKKLQSNVTITFLHNSHDIALHQEIKENTIDLIIFNLGYLPGGDHSIITRPHNTIEALNNAFPKLAKDGIITIVAYPGTPEGMEEKEALHEYIAQLDQVKYNVCHWHPINQANNPPELYLIQKR